ncbi:MAG: hypothetical protein LBD40_00905 [Puniceicoccales bacterium]|jgi:uncharacterized membrane protein YphA (DoxX/SURF4 family)|nr:hypothetical protein [Puniceicoccales bacterium]
MNPLNQFFLKDNFSKFILRATAGTLLAMQGILAFSNPGSLQDLAHAICFLFGCVGQCPSAKILGGIVASFITLGGFCVLIGFCFRSASFVLFLIALSQVLFLRHSGHAYNDPRLLYNILLTGIALSSSFTSPGQWSADGSASGSSSGSSDKTKK